jgi:hypothetical protein
MIKLTNFQEIAGMALDLPDNEAAKIQPGWPQTENDLRGVLRQWNTITGAGVPGLQLLSACKAIWGYKPDNEAEIQGRDILYHPIDGSAIQENSPLDGLTWEMLAFLHWANSNGHLPWNDEVTIVREIKEAGGIIEDLPSDRFYAKNILPCVADGNIDWSDVGLAQAKAMVTSGQQPKASFAQSSEPVYHDETTLQGVLSSIPALANNDARTHLLLGLPSGPCGSIRRNSAPATDINNIVVAVKGFGRLTDDRAAIDVLIDNAIRLVMGTTLAKKLEGFKSAK